ncbi:hypothetical protein [Chryseobacterium sp.]|uniref:hypothetical protein n=1 Tax=Chryseobacterium sp. TaxID=1871047 RepID=UPI002FCABE74
MMDKNIYTNKKLDYSKVIRCNSHELLLLDIELKTIQQYFHSEKINYPIVNLHKINPLSLRIKNTANFNIDKRDYDEFLSSKRIPIFLEYFAQNGLIFCVQNVNNQHANGIIISVFNYCDLALVQKTFHRKQIEFDNLIIEFDEYFFKIFTKFGTEILTESLHFKKKLNNDNDFFDHINYYENNEKELLISTSHYKFPKIFEPYYIFTKEEWKKIVNENYIFNNDPRENIHKEAFIKITTDSWNNDSVSHFLENKEKVVADFYNEIKIISKNRHRLFIQKQNKENSNISPAKFEDPFPNHPEAWDNID